MPPTPQRQSFYSPTNVPTLAGSRRDSTMSAYTGYGGAQAPSLYSPSTFSPSPLAVNVVNPSIEVSDQELVTALKYA